MVISILMLVCFQDQQVEQRFEKLKNKAIEFCTLIIEKEFRDARALTCDNEKVSNLRFKKVQIIRLDMSDGWYGSMDCLISGRFMLFYKFKDEEWDWEFFEDQGKWCVGTPEALYTTMPSKNRYRWDVDILITRKGVTVNDLAAEYTEYTIPER